MLGFVVGDDEENAERRFFAAWTEPGAQRRRRRRRRRRRTYRNAGAARAAIGSDVIGLFPEPGRGGAP